LARTNKVKWAISSQVGFLFLIPLLGSDILSVGVNQNEVLAIQENEPVPPVPPWIKDVLLPAIAIGVSIGLSLYTLNFTKKKEEATLRITKENQEDQNRRLEYKIAVKDYVGMIEKVTLMLQNPKFIRTQPYQGEDSDLVHDTFVEIDHLYPKLFLDDPTYEQWKTLRNSWHTYENSWSDKGTRQEFVDLVFHFREALVSGFNKMNKENKGDPSIEYKNLDLDINDFVVT